MVLLTDDDAEAIALVIKQEINFLRDGYNETITNIINKISNNIGDKNSLKLSAERTKYIYDRKIKEWTEVLNLIFKGSKEIL